MKRRRNISAVRASRDGHEFHEAWAARKALQLVLGVDKLVGISVEGFSSADEQGLPTNAVEIADLVQYHGGDPSFEKSDAVVVIQVKYSHSLQNVAFRAADAKKTIQKFAVTYTSLRERYGAAAVSSKLSFEILTNRPIYAALTTAIENLALGEVPIGDARTQASQFAAASGLSGQELARFAQSVRITGLAGTLRHNKAELARVLADWSAAPDALARARLGKMRDLLREKAGQAGAGKQLITRIDVIAALELQGAGDLLPCPTAFPSVGAVVPRERLQEVANKILTLDRPLLIHADGGVGKTVFLQSLARMLAVEHETELFDCFGGGSYRAPEDSRHLPKRGLVHIANRLACRGLCDPLLPPNESTEDLVKAFKSRLVQAVTTIRRGSPTAQLVLFLDAIDNAAEYAAYRSEPAFPRLLLESFSFGRPVPGVQLVVSCRSYRRTIAKGEIRCEEFELHSFNETETARYLRDRLPDVSDTEVHVAYSRSQGNARILEHLALGDRGLMEPSEIGHVLRLDDLLRHRIERALSDATRRGYPDSLINSFLAGLSILPAPVPLKDYADAHGIEESAVRSFAADLAPLLEHTRHGLMFRDEPTETLVRATHAVNDQTLQDLARNLFAKQASSVYAATALPGLLKQLNSGDLLFHLAFDDRLPAAITSVVGKQKIRYARLRAATHHAAQNNDPDRLVHLLVELSTLAATDKRGAQYVIRNPDLVVASRDIDATRRLFETRTPWPGTRHSRLTIANVLAGDLNDGFRHATNAEDWISHFYRQDEEYRRECGGPEAVDHAALSLCLAAKGRGRDAGRVLKPFYDWYAFEIAEWTVLLLRQGVQLGTIPLECLDAFISNVPPRPGPLAAVLVSPGLDDRARVRVVRRLAVACNKIGRIEMPEGFSGTSRIQDGLLMSAAIAHSVRRRADARRILASAPFATPRLWSLTDRLLSSEIHLFVVRVALQCASERIPVADRMLLPDDLTDIAAHIPKETVGDDYRLALVAAITDVGLAQRDIPSDQRKYSRDFLDNAKRFVQHRLGRLARLAQALTATFASPRETVDDAFFDLLATWRQLRTRGDDYTEPLGRSSLDALGRQCAQFALRARSDLTARAVDEFVTEIASNSITPVSSLIQIVAVLSTKGHVAHLAGKAAGVARAAIEREDDTSERASLFADLARAILPASIAEATTYFRVGLEQMDAIGSGDYRFNNELLNFAGAMRGGELDESDYHTLSNISELNLSESDKFPWISFADGLASASGYRSLARLTRWADRDKASLEYTLLPYLLALVKRDKIQPEIAIALLRLSIPVEFHECGTVQFSELIAHKSYSNTKQLLTELILQYLHSRPGVYVPQALEALHVLAVEQFGARSEISTYLQNAVPRYTALREEQNNLSNQGLFPADRSSILDDRQARDREAMSAIERETDPTSEASVAEAIAALGNLSYSYDLREDMFDRLRSRVPYAARPVYIGIVARLQDCNIHAKLQELSACKSEWGGSSVALDDTFRDIVRPLLHTHAGDLSEFEYLYRSKLLEIGELSGCSEYSLAVELIMIFASADADVSPSVWLGLATIILDKARDGEGQTALTRLLNSNAAQLASTVSDGPWRDGLYPDRGEAEMAAGLIWFALGSPSADQRWRAAHSVRSLARTSKWDVIDALVARIESVDSHPYQAPELTFYHLHARLWLLVALARLALDHPSDISRYAASLRAVAFSQEPHVLMKHFAVQALLACADCAEAGVSDNDIRQLRSMTASAYPVKVVEGYPRESFYDSRPAASASRENEFHLEYDFDKHDVSHVSDMFGASRWDLKKAMTAWVHRHDPNVRSMYDAGGRERPYVYRHTVRTPHYHAYGYYLGWHALFSMAGEYLSKFPVVRRPYDEDDPWLEWMSREVLTRNDQLWLADGVEWPPVDAEVNLLEAGTTQSAITGDDAKLLALVKSVGRGSSDCVVAGDWRSTHGVSIHISSALVPKRRASKFARQLVREDPFQAWLPQAEEGEESVGADDAPGRPWIVWPRVDGKLDASDTLGVVGAAMRLRMMKSIATAWSISSSDPFGMQWVNLDGLVVLRSQAWCQRSPPDEGDRTGGLRLLCASSLIGEIMSHYESELIVLIKLRRYVPSMGDRSSEFWHTMAVVRIDAQVNCHLYMGVVNKLHESKF